jgi:predicted nucleic acid-binding protein
MEESNLDETAVDERGEENHEEYCQSQIDNEEYMNNLYDPNDFMILDINSKSKARSLKNVILDKKNLKKANIVLFKQVSSKEKQGQWAQFTPQDFELQVKDFASSVIAFKIYLDIRVTGEGRGHTYQ